MRVRLSGCRLGCTWGLLEATGRVEGACTDTDMLSKIILFILGKSNIEINNMG